MNRPNIIYINSHDTGRYIQPYGYPIHSPNMQRFAQEGVLFRQAFCTNPTCSPSRSSLLTGMYPHNNGMTGLAHRGFKLNDYSQGIIHTLHKAGYDSMLIGGQHIVPNSDENPLEITGFKGYEPCWSFKERRIRIMPGDAAVQYLEHPPQEPFYLELGFGRAHRHFDPLGPDEDPRYTLPPAPLPDTPRNREDMARFKTTVRLLDEEIGQVLDCLENSPLAKNTLVIIATDHGIPFPRMKCNLTDAGIGVLLMIRGPGGFNGGKVVDAMVSHIDIFPTICELLDIEKPSWLQGVSIVPLIRGEKETVRDEVFAGVNYHAAYEPQRCVRTERWKYIRRWDTPKPVLANCDSSPSKDVWMDHGWAEHDYDDEYLYDVIFDPNETNNLVKNPKYKAPLEDMRGRLDRWMRETNDPLLSGTVEAPKGAVVDAQTAVKPS